MNFSDDDLKDFKLEAVELIEAAERSLLALDRGQEFKINYDSIFRAFHSIKGAAGMLALDDLQAHMHQLESLLLGRQGLGSIPKKYIDLFLKGSDAALKMLAGEAVQFDYRIPGDAPSPLEQQAVLPELGSGKSGRVLVVDDEPAIVEMVSDLLASRGFKVAGAAGAEEALGLVSSFIPDVILTDINMPGMSGSQLLKAIRLSSPDVPVVFVSGNVNKEVLMGAIPDDVFGVVEKPFRIEEIVEVCERAVATPRPVQLLGQSIKALLGRFSDLDDFMRARGRLEEREALEKEIVRLLEGLGGLQRRVLEKAA